MVNKILYTCVMLCALPFVYSALAVLFLVSMLASAVNDIGRIWR